MAEEAAKDKKYYWLKLKRDFFKRHDIQIIEGMPNGKDYILFYLKLLCESVDHDGSLRFSDEIPYNEDMLATITNTNIDIVRSAVRLFEGLKMLEIMDDGTYYMNQVQKMIGSETYWAQKKREQRELIGQCPTDVQQLSNGCPTCPSKSIDTDIDKELDIDTELEGDIEREHSSLPTLQQIKEYVSKHNLNVDPDRFFSYYNKTNWKTTKGNPVNWQDKLKEWNNTETKKEDSKPQKSSNPFLNALKNGDVGND